MHNHSCCLILVGCSVSILRDDGYLHTIIAAALTGVVLLFAATTALLHVYRNHAIVAQLAALTGYILYTSIRLNHSLITLTSMNYYLPNLPGRPIVSFS